MTEYNILFLGGAKRVSMARKMIAAGEKLSLKVGIFGYELSRRCALACVARDIVEGKRWSDSALYDDLRRVISDLNIRMIVPFVDPAVEVAARCRDLFPGVWTPVGTIGSASLMFDKLLAAQEFEKAGLPIPETMWGTSPRFPLIAKPRRGSASKGIVTAMNQAEWDNLSIFHPDYILQEYIVNAEEYTVDCYRSVADGRTLCVSPRRRLEVSGGEVVSTITVDDPEVSAQAARALEALDLRGAVTVQLLREPATGRVMIMEVNPRLGGGAVATVCAGADIPLLMLSEATGGNPAPVKARTGILVQRYLEETTFDTNE